MRFIGSVSLSTLFVSRKGESTRAFPAEIAREITRAEDPRPGGVFQLLISHSFGRLRRRAKVTRILLTTCVPVKDKTGEALPQASPSGHMSSPHAATTPTGEAGATRHYA